MQVGHERDAQVSSAASAAMPLAGRRGAGTPHDAGSEVDEIRGVVHDDRGRRPGSIGARLGVPVPRRTTFVWLAGRVCGGCTAIGDAVSSAIAMTTVIADLVPRGFPLIPDLRGPSPARSQDSRLNFPRCGESDDRGQTLHGPGSAPAGLTPVPVRTRRQERRLPARRRRGPEEPHVLNDQLCLYPAAARSA